jgi:hypothetical protein
VAVDAAGAAVAAWSGFGVSTATRPAAGAWQPPMRVAPAAVGLFDSDVQVAASDAGGAGVAWWRRSEGTGGEPRSAVLATLRGADGNWEPPQRLSPTSVLALEPRLGLDGEGAAFALWWATDPDGRNARIQAVVRPPGGDWGPVETLSAPNRLRSDLAPLPPPRLAVASSGLAVALWTIAVDRERAVVQSTTRRWPGAWSAPLTISTSGDIHPDLQLAVDSASSPAPTALWQRTVAGRVRLEFARHSPAGSWSAPRPVPTSLGAGRCAWSPQDPRLAVARTGEVIVAWTEGEVVRATSRLPGTRWSAPRDLSVARASGVQLGVDGSGTITAAWRRLDPRNPTVEAATRRASPSPRAGGLPQPRYPAISRVRLERPAAGPAHVRFRLSAAADVGLRLNRLGGGPLTSLYIPTFHGRRGENRARLVPLGRRPIPPGRYRLSLAPNAGPKVGCAATIAIRFGG